MLFSCLFCSFFFFLSLHIFTSAPIKKAGIVCALALAEADRKVQRLSREGRHRRGGGGERRGEGEKQHKQILVRKIRVIVNLLCEGEMGLRASLGTPGPSGRLGCIEDSQSCVFGMILQSYFHCQRELCNEGSLDLTEASQGLRSWHSFQICDITTSCLEGTGSIYGCLYLTGKIVP